MSGAFELTSITPNSVMTPITINAGGFNYPPEGFFDGPSKKTQRAMIIAGTAVSLALIAAFVLVRRR